MRPLTGPLQALLEEMWLDLDDLCRLAGVDPGWVQQRVAEGLLSAREPAPDAAGWRFDAAALHRVRRLVVLERDFDAVPELAALVADLEDEVRHLRQRLQR